MHILLYASKLNSSDENFLTFLSFSSKLNQIYSSDYHPHRQAFHS